MKYIKCQLPAHCKNKQHVEIQTLTEIGMPWLALLQFVFINKATSLLLGGRNLEGYKRTGHILNGPLHKDRIWKRGAHVNIVCWSRLRAQLKASVEEVPQKVEVLRDADNREKEFQQLKAQLREDMEKEVSLHKSMSEQAMACIKADLERQVQM